MVQQEQDQVLGRDARGPITAERLDVVPWSHGNTDAVVEFTTNELTATCPITGQPDFYELKLSYRPKGSRIESKALKLYLWVSATGGSSPRTSPRRSLRISPGHATHWR